MNPSLFRFVKLWLVLFLVLLGPKPVQPAEPKVQILSPKTDDRITQDQSTILVSGKVASQAARSSNVDIMLVLDTSGSTKDYSGADFAELSDLPPNYLHLPAQPNPQFSVSLGGRVVVVIFGGVVVVVADIFFGSSTTNFIGNDIFVSVPSTERFAS